MANPSDVIVGAYFRTETDQLRKITGVSTDDDGNVVVEYMSKSAKIPNRKFEFAATKANPATLETFLDGCGERLSDEEINQLRDDNILLADE